MGADVATPGSPPSNRSFWPARRDSTAYSRRQGTAVPKGVCLCVQAGRQAGGQAGERRRFESAARAQAGARTALFPKRSRGQNKSRAHAKGHVPTIGGGSTYRLVTNAHITPPYKHDFSIPFPSLYLLFVFLTAVKVSHDRLTPAHPCSLLVAYSCLAHRPVVLVVALALIQP